MSKAQTRLNDGNGWGRPQQLYTLKPEKGHINKLLYDLLATATPTGMEDRIMGLLPDAGNHNRYVDAKGNVFFLIGKVKQHGTMFSCHMDTVHSTAETVVPLASKDWWVYGSVRGPDREEKGITLPGKLHPAILGADDKLGMWLMLKMMEAKVPGVYVFHTGEEKGGLGSRYSADSQYTKKLLANVKRCVALDRAGYNNIITHQRGDRCCSDEFAKALAKQLNEMSECPKHINWFPDSTGVFTDSANYTNIVPECTNLSVGYFRQHGTTEHFDLIWLEKNLLPMLLKVKWHELPTVREKGWSEKLNSNKWGNQGNEASRQQYMQDVRNQQELQRQQQAKSTDIVKGNTPTLPETSPFSGVDGFTSYEKIPTPEAEAFLMEMLRFAPRINSMETCLLKIIAEKRGRETAQYFMTLLRAYRKVKDAHDDLLISHDVELAKIKWQLDAEKGHVDFAWSEVAELYDTIEKLSADNKRLIAENASLKGNKKRTVSIVHGGDK